MFLRVGECTTGADSWWLQPQKDRRETEKAIAGYITAPGDAAAEAAIAAITRDKHSRALNERLAQMFSRTGESSMDQHVIFEHKRMASFMSVVTFAHSRMETQEFLMETLEHHFRMSPPGECEIVDFQYHWTLARMKVPGLARQEYTATLVANDTRILRASEMESSVSKQAITAIQEHLAANSIGSKDFCWLLSFLASFPSDDAFDVISAAMPVSNDAE